MIGRTPEYLGKKIEAYDMKMVSIVILATPLLVLGGTALAVSVSAGQAGVLNPGIHGFSEILYALTSAANNNGSAFAGLSANTPFYNVLLGAAMWFGRFAIIVAVLAMAGSLAAKRRLPAGPGSMPTHGPLFVVLLIGAVLLVGADLRARAGAGPSPSTCSANDEALPKRCALPLKGRRLTGKAGSVGDAHPEALRASPQGRRRGPAKPDRAAPRTASFSMLRMARQRRETT